MKFFATCVQGAARVNKAGEADAVLAKRESGHEVDSRQLPLDAVEGLGEQPLRVGVAPLAVVQVAQIAQGESGEKRRAGHRAARA